MADPTTPTAGRAVFCVKLQKEAPGLDEVPFDGHPLGQRIYENVSKEAWKGWVEHMKMIMNEYRLNLGQPEAHGLNEVGRPALVDALGCGHRDDDHHDGADDVDNRRRWSGDD